MSRTSIAEATETLLKVLAPAVLIALVCASVNAGVYRQMVTHPTVFCLMLDCFLIHVLTNASRREALVTVGIPAAAWLAWPVVTGRNLNWPWGALATLGCLLGVSSLFILCFRAITRQGAAGRNKLQTLMRGGIFVFMALWSIPLLKMLDRVRPEKLDVFLYRFDSSFGIQPSFAMGRLFAASPALHNFAFAIYLSVALPAAFVYIGHLRHEGQWPVKVLQALLLNSAIGFALYAVFPAAGPVFAFPRDYPFHQIAFAFAKPMLFQASPNAIPSIHTSTALLIWFNSRPWRIGRMLAFIFLFFTMVATLGLGEHYIVDLAVAVPYALTIQSLCVRGFSRKSALIPGALLTGGWLLLLRAGQPLFPAPALAWLLVLGSTVSTLWLESRLGHYVFAGEERAGSDAAGLFATNSAKAIARVA